MGATSLSVMQRRLVGPEMHGDGSVGPRAPLAAAVQRSRIPCACCAFPCCAYSVLCVPFLCIPVLHVFVLGVWCTCVCHCCAFC